MGGSGDGGRRPNTLLSHARLARGLTQQELAEAVNDAHRQLFDRDAAIDANHVSKLERGVIARPNRRYRDAFRTVLGVSADTDLGFSRPDLIAPPVPLADPVPAPPAVIPAMPPACARQEQAPTEKETTTDRRDLFHAGSVTITSLSMDRLWSEPSRMHSALDRGSVSSACLTELRRDASDLSVRVVQVPPGTLTNESLAQFRIVRKLISRRQTISAQRGLASCGAMLATVLGEILFNQGDFPLARRWYGIARRAAEEAGDQYHADISLAGSTYLPTYTPDPQAVLDNVSPRLESQPTPSPAVAWLWGFRAKAHATLGNRRAFRESIDQSRQTLDRSAPDLVRPGIFSFVPEKLALYEARGWVELGDSTEASAAAQRAVSMYDFNETTEPALAQFEQASAFAQMGELPEACKIAIGVLLDHRTYHGVTVIARAHEFDRLLGPSNSESSRDWREVLSAVRQPPSAFGTRGRAQGDAHCSKVAGTIRREWQVDAACHVASRRFPGRM